MSKHKPGFPGVGKKGKETRFSSRIAGCGCDCDPAWSVEPPVALRAGCCVHTGLAACDPVLSQGKRKVPGLSSTRVMEIWLPWAFLLPWMGSSAHPQAIASAHCLHKGGISPAWQGGRGLLLQVVLSCSLLPGTEGDDECWAPAGTGLACPRLCKIISTKRARSFSQ